MGFESPEKRAFKACPETCPKVNSAANKLELTIASLSDIESEFEMYREAEGTARDNLREALVEAYRLLGDAEDEIAELKKELSRVQT